MSAAAAAAGIALEVADWVPARDSTYGGWGVVSAGGSIDTPLAWTKTEPMLELPPGRYDVYWVQDYDKRDRPMLLAAAVTVAADGLAVVKADSGIALAVAPWIPERDKTYGWWGAVDAGGSVDASVNWTSTANALLLPPGSYDVYWVQDYATRDRPLPLATGVAVRAGQRVEVKADSGIVLAVASWVPERDNTYGWWGAVAAGGSVGERVNWTNSAEALLLPPGSYDLYWVQDYATRSRPLPLATGVRVEANQRVEVEADSGIALAVASWVPGRDPTYGWWGAVATGGSVDASVNWTNTANSLLLPPGTYDVYWVQDYATRERPLVLASGIAVESGELVALKAGSGVRIAVADWVPERDATYGWWGAVKAGDAVVAWVNWTNSAEALLLPPGNYDIYWAQDYQSRDRPVRLASVLVQPGEFGGVGLEVAQGQDGIVVVRALSGGPAERAGVLEGDQVLAVQGEPMQGKTLAEAVQRLRGEAGSTVTLSLQRQGVAQPFDVLLERSLVTVPPTLVRVDSGIRVAVGTEVPPLDDSGWWGAVLSRRPPDELVNWSKGQSATPLVLPPGVYDIWWRRKSAEEPQLMASSIEVAAGSLVEVPIGSGAEAPAETADAGDPDSEAGGSGAEWVIVQAVTARPPDLADDFSNPASGWTVLEAPGISIGYADGAYRIALETTRDLMQAGFVDWEVGNGVVQVDATDASGSFAHPFGLFVRVQDAGNYHFFIMAADGSYAMLRRQNDRPAMDSYGVMPPGAYRSDGPNRVQALLLSEQIIYFVNGLEVARTRALWPSGGIGVLSVNPTAGKSEVFFDDVKAWLAAPQ